MTATNTASSRRTARICSGTPGLRPIRGKHNSTSPLRSREQRSATQLPASATLEGDGWVNRSDLATLVADPRSTVGGVNGPERRQKSIQFDAARSRDCYRDHPCSSCWSSSSVSQYGRTGRSRNLVRFNLGGCTTFSFKATAPTRAVTCSPYSMAGRMRLPSPHVSTAIAALCLRPPASTQVASASQA